VTTRGFRVFSTRLRRVTPRVLAAVLLPALTGLVLLAAPAPAQAQMTQAQKDEVKLHYQRATRAYDLQKYQEAIDEYQKAYEISGDPPMLYNIAQAYRLADQPAEAVRYYRRFLQRMPNARNRDDVERKIADQEKIAEERRKSEPVTPPPPPATKPPPIVEVKPPPPVAPPVTPPAVTPPTQPVPEISHTGTVVGWCLIGAGLIVDGVAAYEGYRAKQKGDQLTRDSMANPAKTFDPSLETDGKNANIAAIALAIGGTVVAVAGAIVLISSGGSSSDQPDRAATPVARLTLTPWISTGLVGGGARLQF
jgi:tetratricopeptide (TPR) repeat protein